MQSIQQFGQDEDPLAWLLSLEQCGPRAVQGRLGSRARSLWRLQALNISPCSSPDAGATVAKAVKALRAGRWILHPCGLMAALEPGVAVAAAGRVAESFLPCFGGMAAGASAVRAPSVLVTAQLLGTRLCPSPGAAAVASGSSGVSGTPCAQGPPALGWPWQQPQGAPAPGSRNKWKSQLWKRCLCLLGFLWVRGFRGMLEVSFSNLAVEGRVEKYVLHAPKVDFYVLSKTFFVWPAEVCSAGQLKALFLPLGLVLSFLLKSAYTMFTRMF